MHFLLDTNILIPAEPTSPADLEAGTPAVAGFLNALSRGQHVALLHPASVAELAGDRNQERAAARAVLVRKYPELTRPPAMSSRLVASLGAPRAGSHSEVDLLLLSTVDANAVDYFVTEDEGIHRRARRTGLADRVLTVADAIVTIEALFPTVPESPPFVAPRLAYELDDTDPIFDSFRSDYAHFDVWLTRCKREHRQSWIIQAGPTYGGICIVKDESINEYGLRGKVLKICSLKIADDFRGQRYGELLLKTVFGYLVENNYDSVFLEAFAKHAELLALLSDFGFEDVGDSTKGERVLRKLLHPPSQQVERLGPLDFNIKYGPHAISLAGAQAFVVPIRPEYHSKLFPELEEQMVFATESRPFGNSIRKAYLCHSNIRKIAAGDLVLFYRSTVRQGVTAVGIVEGSLVSDNAVEITRFVGKRTVYTFAEIDAMASKPVLAVLFRLARTLRPHWDVDLLKRTGIIKRPPQSFMEVNGKAVDWIAETLSVPH